ncbi:MAG: hypothetical protein R2788_08830 [Saprospiraceae bacterium]
MLDGFTISGGNADGSPSNNNRGGGMYNRSSSPTVTNCSFSDNTGDRMENNSFSSPMVTNFLLFLQ